MTNTSKTNIESESQKLIGQKFYDLRYDDYYTVISADKSGNWLNLQYKKFGAKRQATSFITYHIDQKQHIKAIN